MDLAVTHAVARAARRSPGRRVFRLLIGIAASIAPLPARAESVADRQPFVVEASTRFGVPMAWINRVIQAESRGRTTLAGRPITSSAGAMGLMQLMPLTWSTMRGTLRLGADPYDPHDNIIAGTAYLRMLYDRFGYPGLFAAYNAGPTRYAAHLATGRALPAETRNYVAMIAGDPNVASLTPAPQRPERMFVELITVPNGSAASGAPSSARGMFIALSRP